MYYYFKGANLGIYGGIFGAKTALCQTLNIFDPRHAHFVHGRSRITCMYMLSALSSDGGQGEYSRTHVPH